MELLVRVYLAFEKADHVISSRIGYGREAKFLDVSPILRIARIVEMFGSDIGVKAVREWIVRCANVASGAAACFKNSNIVPTPDQLVGTGEPGDPGTDDDYSLLSSASLCA